ETPRRKVRRCADFMLHRGPRLSAPPSEVFEGRKRFPGAWESKAVSEKSEVELAQAMLDVARHAKRGILAKCDDWPEEYPRLATAALAVYNRRFGDFATSEFVTLMWLALGRARVISADGRARFFDPNSGGWRAYTGLFPEGMHAHFRLFMNRLGRRQGVERGADSILEKMDAIIQSSDGDSIEQKTKNAFQMFEHFSLWNKGSGDREEAVADVGEGPGTKQLEMPWHIDVAACIRSFGKKLVSELMQGGSVVKNFTEWCGTSVAPARGVCYPDRAVKYDVPMMTPDGVVVQPLVVVDGVPTSKDLFFSCMDSSLVPAMREDEGAEDEGPERPLDDPVLKAAADDVNKFLSSTFWYNFEALSATRPQRSKNKLLLNLWKKFLSGEGLRRRPPYAVLTRMIRLLGWVKREVNSTLAFSDFTEQEFESIMRRSCVIEIAARLFDKQYLGARFPDREECGIFARDPSFARKFQTSQCAAAWNRTQHVFEASNEGQQCVMVDADASEFLLQAPPSATAEERESAVALLRETCDRGLEAMTLPYFDQRARRLEGRSAVAALPSPLSPFKCTVDDLFGAAATVQKPGALPEAIDVANVKKKKLVDNVAFMQNAELAIEEEEPAIRNRIEKFDTVRRFAAAVASLPSRALGRVLSGAAEPGAEVRRSVMAKEAATRVHAVRVQYQMSRPWVSRERATAGDVPAAQSTPQHLQMMAFPQTVDLDQVAACLAFSEQLLELLRLAEDVKAAFVPELAPMKELREDRDGVYLRELGLPGALGKDLILMALYGKKELPYATLLDPDCEGFLNQLKRLSWFLRWAAASAMPEQYAALKGDSSVTWVEGSCFAHFWQMAESYVTMHLCDFARQRPVKHLTKACDGVRMDADRVADEKARLAVEEQGMETQSDTEVVALAASRYVVQQPLALVVRLRDKKHLPFYNLIHNCEYSDVTIAPSLVPAQDLSSVLITVPTALGDYGSQPALAQQLMQLVREHAERDLAGVTYLE
ncbi:unnamed protein product, partial [Prorocentrum cordatum]